MEDIEKNRVEYVARLEATVEHLRAEYERYKAIAEKWEPKVTSVMDPKTQTVKIGLMLGGKGSQAQISFTSLAETDATTAVSAIVDVLVESNVAARLREAVAPEVDKLLPSVKATLAAGNWGGK